MQRNYLIFISLVMVALGLLGIFVEDLATWYFVVATIIGVLGFVFAITKSRA